jgi:hypothetical protein
MELPWAFRSPHRWLDGWARRRPMQSISWRTTRRPIAAPLMRSLTNVLASRCTTRHLPRHRRLGWARSCAREVSSAGNMTHTHIPCACCPGSAFDAIGDVVGCPPDSSRRHSECSSWRAGTTRSTQARSLAVCGRARTQPHWAISRKISASPAVSTAPVVLSRAAQLGHSTMSVSTIVPACIFLQRNSHCAENCCRGYV